MEFLLESGEDAVDQERSWYGR